ncbi:MAG TPA: hypothetical protein PLH46_00880 [Caldisericia bacterium]|nr:hypothetical protein [Caldisericia bacterium]
MKKIDKKKAQELFTKDVTKWLDFFGLNDWFVNISTSASSEDCPEDSVAFCSYVCEGKSAGIALIDRESYFEELVKIAAFHEVCELLLADITFLASERGFSKTIFDIARHSLIRRLESSVFKTLDKKLK